MQSETLTRQYEHALTLAESGRYAQALEQMLDYLKVSPGDGKALNDAGTILFCMQRGVEAVAYFEKALTVCQGDELTQVYWNLCEAYVQQEMPAKAAELFVRMRHQGILNADILNRTADVFLQKNDLGGAVETLLLSLSLSPEQDVLRTMLEIIRNHRTKAAIFSDHDTPVLHAIRDSLEERLPVQTFIGADAATAERMRQAGAVIFAGAGESLARGLNFPKGGKVIVLLDESDIYGAAMPQVNWRAADMILACASADAIADFKERTGVRAVTPVQYASQAQHRSGPEKKAGKRLAAIGPWNVRRNPMFLLQCFQKLHYCDADTRLYLAGEFEDSGLERYVKAAAEAMNLDTVVFFDGPVKNLNKWLKDKHFIVSTAIDASSLAGVWAGMANGLKPIVHRFAGVESLLSDSYVFTLSEDFCNLAGSGEFEPGVYRAMAQEQYERNGAAHKVHALICRTEKAEPQTAERTGLPDALPAASRADLSQHAHSASQTVQPISTLAEQALSAARALREIMHQPPSGAGPTEFGRACQTGPDSSYSQNSTAAGYRQQAFSVEPFIDTEPAAVPFAR